MLPDRRQQYTNSRRQRNTRSTARNVGKITTTRGITGTRPHKGKADCQAEEVRRKRVGSKRRKGAVPRKAKKPTAGQKQITDRRINVINITDVPETDYSSESINFSCYVQSETSEWLMDSGCSKHVTSHIADYIGIHPSTALGRLKSQIRRS